MVSVDKKPLTGVIFECGAEFLRFKIRHGTEFI